MNSATVPFYMVTTETLVDYNSSYVKDHGATAYGDELRKRAIEEDGMLDPREKELIDKATNGTLTDAERSELINLLPTRSKKGFETENYSDDTVDSLLKEVKLVGKEDTNGDGVVDVIAPHDRAAIDELRHRAADSGKMTPELNALLHKAEYTPDQLTDQEYARLRVLMGA